jgi:hypothetical protein
MAKIDTTTVKKPVIYFAMEAWLKMLTLVKNCDKEIAWQATVEKRKFKNKEDSDDFFYFIKQVFVYPQKVTGTFVDVDTVKYAEWSLKLEEETYNNLRFQGHSHVNMCVSPSGTDLNTYQNFLDQLNKDDFYIFMIMNKKQEFNIMVYDYAQDILFDNADCFVDILTPQGSLNRWSEENMKLVEHKQEIPTWSKNWYEDDFIQKNPYTTNYGNGTSLNQPLSQTNKAQNITYVSWSGYTQNGKWNQFKNLDEVIDWFLDNPEYIDKANLTREQKTMLLSYYEPLTPIKNTQPKKRGRPPKGSK